MMQTPRKPDRSKAGRPAGHAAAGGLTLPELLVSVAVLVILILVFNIVLSQAQHVVSRSEAKMRSNAAVAAIADVMRNSLRRVTPNGFLCITQDRREGWPQLFFTTAGPTPSLTATKDDNLISATATVAGYGLCKRANGPGLVLWHAAWLLAPLAPGDLQDVWTADLSDFLRMTTRTRVDGWVTTVLSNRAPDRLAVPVRTLNDMMDHWKSLAPDCTALSITWTEGELDDNEDPNWYGLDYRVDKGEVVRGLAPKDDDWRRKDPETGIPEYAAPGPGLGAYRALWTYHDQRGWPKAVKIKFRITDPDPDLPPELRNADYEVICPLGQ